MLSSLEKLGSCDPQIALILLRMCGGFTKLVHVTRSIPPSLALDEPESAVDIESLDIFVLLLNLRNDVSITSSLGLYATDLAF